VPGSGARNPISRIGKSRHGFFTRVELLIYH
jgi:hypothetical protein